MFAVDGTPADCVYVALNAGTRVLPRRPDIVVSGMNHGLNLGSDIFYSGTVAAAREGVIRGVPAVATSADVGADRERAAEVCAQIALVFAEIQMRNAAAAPTEGPDLPRGDAVAARVHALRTGPAPLLNVNVPPGRHWPVAATRLGLRVYDDIVEFRHDPRGREYLWLGGGGVRHGSVPDSDTDAYDRGAVSITPLLLDLTAAPHAALADTVAHACSGSPSP